MQRRTIQAERHRDDLLISVKSLENEMKRLKSEHDDETLRCYSNNQTLENRVKKLQREVEDCKHENYSLLQSVNLYKTEVQKYEEQSRYSKLEATKKFANELNTLQRENKQLEMKLKKSAERSS